MSDTPSWTQMPIGQSSSAPCTRPLVPPHAAGEEDYRRDYEMLRDAVMEHLSAFVQDGDSSEPEICVAAIATAGIAFSAIEEPGSCQFCGDTVPTGYIHSCPKGFLSAIQEVVD